MFLCAKATPTGRYKAPARNTKTLPGLKMAFGTACSLVLLLAAILTVTDAAKPVAKSEIGPKKILVVLPLSAPSHHHVFSSLSNELLERGHYITVVTARSQKQKHPRLREILVRDPFEEMLGSMVKTLLDGPKNIFQNTFMMFMMGPAMVEVVFENPKVLALKDEKFDLLITETFFFQEPVLGFAHHFGCPSMALNPFGYAFHLNDMTGGATNPAYVPNIFAASIIPESFIDRLKNTLHSVVWMLAYHLYYLARADAQMHAAFPDAPPLYDLINNVSITLINNKHALMYPVPLAPSVIEVGGMHIKPGKPLQPDLKKWIEESKDGIVYFSLGSNLQANLLPEEKINILLASFGKLKQRVLIKWNAEIPANAPKNCRFEEWVPQQEVLAHPNLKVFFTHGGLLSTQESVFYGTPIIGMPVFGDQHMNMDMAIAKGFAVKVSLKEMSSQEIDAALTEVINNPKYRERSIELSEHFRLDPVASLDKAVYYTENLMRLGSFPHLQPSSVNLSWYQYMLLDVIAVIAIGLYITWKIFRYVCSALFGCCCKSSKSKKD